MKAILHTDGGARGNPGPAGIGFVLHVQKKEKILHSEYIGETTNNQAEYQALLAGIKRALMDGVTEMQCYLDSELVVKQLTGEYRVKDVGLRVLYDEICALKDSFETISFQHVRREKNKGADKLVNEALDAHLGKSSK